MWTTHRKRQPSRAHRCSSRIKRCCFSSMGSPTKTWIVTRCTCSESPGMVQIGLTGGPDWTEPVELEGGYPLSVTAEPGASG